MAEVSDLENALAKVCKAAFCEDNLARGINESCRAIENRYEGNKAVLCLLADDCDEAQYKKLVTALCKTNGVALQTIDQKKKLAVYSGLCRFDKDGQPKKIVKKCSSLVIKKWPKTEEAAVSIVKQHFNIKN